jgi:hypothetical protein
MTQSSFLSLWLIGRVLRKGKSLTATGEMSPPHGFSLGCEWSKIVGYNPLSAICDAHWVPANPPPTIAVSIMIFFFQLFDLKFWKILTKLLL